MDKNIELIHLEYLEKRFLALDTNKLKKLKYLTRGYQGEAEFLLWFKKFGSEHAKIIPNYWFHDGKTMESDFLIMTEKVWYTVDVKNFDGTFEYKNNECWLNGYLFDENFFHTMSTRVRKLQRIAQDVSSNIEVVGAMVFINEHCELKIDSQVDFDIVTRNQLKNYLTTIKQYRPLPTDYNNQIDTVLDRYRTTNPFRPIGLKPVELDKLRRGICCYNCSSYSVQITKKNIKCKQCNFDVLKREGVIEAARQLRYIFIDNPEFVTTDSVWRFCDNLISKNTIRRALTSQYERKSSGKSTYYDIPISN